MSRKYYCEIIVNLGLKINLMVDEAYAPKTVKNFVRLVRNHYYDGMIFHRVIKDFMIQAGGYTFDGEKINEADPVMTIPGEFKDNGFENNLKHTLGVISMARTSDPNSASNQFFLCCGDCEWLDGKYAAFGKTVDEESNQAILQIASMPTFAPHPSFADMPCDIIQIDSITLLGEE